MLGEWLSVKVCPFSPVAEAEQVLPEQIFEAVRMLGVGLEEF